MSEHRPPDKRSSDEAYAIKAADDRGAARALLERNLRDPRALLEKLIIGEMIARRPGR